MTLWLDNLVFGHGRGMKTPYFDDRFYWLVDTAQGRDGKNGTLYSWIGGLGAQLASRQWTMPIPGETRTLLGRKFRVFNANRRGPRVEVSWATKLPAGIDEANAALREIRADLLDDLMDYARPKAAPHPDNLAVDRFASAMRQKLAKKRDEGRGGWEDTSLFGCKNEDLSRMLRKHVAKGDPVDVGNFAMMIHQRGERIAEAEPVYPPLTDRDREHLNWIADRLVHQYGESPNVDFVLRLREIANG